MLDMTDIAAITNRLVLVAPRRQGDTKIRRYRIARLKVEDAGPSSSARGAVGTGHLKRAYD